MKRKNVVRIAVALIIVLVIGVIAYSFIRPNIGPCTEYKCDVKVLFKLSTSIEIEKEGEPFAKVSGNIFKFVTDPLTLYDTAGNKIAYAGDEYHFIAQDSHSIYLNNGLAAEMVGRINFFGETYDIYNTNQEKIARVSFDKFNIKGKMTDANGKLIADFHSYPFFNDFTVRISEDCEMDENVVLMIFSSYYSDQKADSNTTSTNSHKNSKN